MAKINPKQHTETYKEQKAFDRTVPVSGTFDVVGVKMQWQKVGQKGTERLRIVTHVLRVVEAADEEGARKMVGGSFGRDVWWNLYKDDGETLSFNGVQLVNAAIACGCSEEFDPDDRDELVKILTGTPYRIKIDVKKGGSDERPFYNVDVIEVKHLSADARKRYTSAPDWNKTVPKLEDRLLDDADYSKPKDGGNGKSDSKPKDKSDAGFIDDDLPFDGAIAA
jgi:hypothetical protein